MNSAFRLLVGGLAMAAVAMAGCSAKRHIALNDDAAQRIRTVKLISVIPQAVVVPSIEPWGGTAAMGVMFGAIGGAIAGGVEAGRYEKAAEKLAALVEPQKRIGLRQELSDRLRLATEGSNRFVIQEAETVIEGDGENERDRALKEMAQDAVLTVVTQYYLSPDFRVFNVSSQAELRPKGSEKEVYLGWWHYHSTPQDGDGEQAIISAWAADSGEELVTVAHEAIDKIALMMKIDLLGEPVDPGGLGTATVSYTLQAKGQRVDVDGKLLRRESGWVVVRSEDGHLHAAPVP